MAKRLPKVNLHIETAQSALSVLSTLLAEKLHKDDRKQIDSLIDRAREGLDKATGLLSDLRSAIDQISDQL